MSISVESPALRGAVLFCLAWMLTIGCLRVQAGDESEAFKHVASEEAAKRVRLPALGIHPAGAPRVKDLKSPEGDGAKLGHIPFSSGQSIAVCMIPSKEEKDVLTFILDLNGNKDLTDDKQYRLPMGREPTDIVLEQDGRKSTFSAQTGRNSRGFVVLLRPKEWFEGTLNIGGEVNVAQVADRNLDGKISVGDHLYLRPKDEEGKTPQQKPQVMVLEEEIVMNSGAELVALKPAPDGSRVLVGPYEGPTCAIRLDLSKLMDLEGATVSCRIITPARTSFSTTQPAAGFTMQVPAIEYTYLRVDAKQGDRALRFSVRKPKTKDQEELVLVPEKPTIGLTVSQKGGKIQVDQKINTTQGISYSLKRDRKGPAVEIFTAEGEKPLTQGNMKYG